MAGWNTRHVHVVATTNAGTQSALRTASGLAEESGAGIILIIPCEVSFAPGAGLRSHPTAIVNTYRALAAAVGVDPVVRVCICRRRYQVFERLLIAQAEVVVGGKRRRWWLSREERLARRLSAAGHRVTFVDSVAAAAPRGHGTRTLARHPSV